MYLIDDLGHYNRETSISYHSLVPEGVIEHVSGESGANGVKLIHSLVNMAAPTDSRLLFFKFQDKLKRGSGNMFNTVGLTCSGDTILECLVELWSWYDVTLVRLDSIRPMFSRTTESIVPERSP